MNASRDASPFPSALTRRATLLGLGSLAAGLAGCSAPASQEAASSSAPPASTSASASESAADSSSATPTPSGELPGGGREIFPARRFVALYGTPGTGALGVLGEQDLPASIERVRALAKTYEPFSEEPIQPAFEMIATVASADAGPDGAYSRPVKRDRLEEWVDGAGAAGIHVILDLQTGFEDFPTQAKRIEDLLKRPHVGLALDPEWRLRPGQKHMRDIGQVTAAEINETSAWLSDLVASEGLPEKLFVLHQFRSAMIEQRSEIVAREGLAFLLHADGHGTHQLKKETYSILRKNLPDHIRMAWKNFYDEDKPMMTPEQTMANDPKPWLVSFQ